MGGTATQDSEEGWPEAGCPGPGLAQSGPGAILPGTLPSSHCPPAGPPHLPPSLAETGHTHTHTITYTHTHTHTHTHTPTMCATVSVSLQVYQWLSVLLSPYHHRLASHCLLQSSHLSLAHHAATMLGKKIRKYGHRDSSHPFQDVLMTLQDSCGPCPDSGDPLVLARAVLQPPTFPPPLSHTLSLLASLPDGCQLTTACLAPPTTSQVQSVRVCCVLCSALY